jgi:hypothetical protein
MSGESRFIGGALFLYLHTIPDAKPVPTLLELPRLFPAIPDAKPVPTFAGIASLVSRNSGRKAGSHFCWNCSGKQAVIRPVRLPMPRDGVADGRRR